MDDDNTVKKSINMQETTESPAKMGLYEFLDKRFMIICLTLISILGIAFHHEDSLILWVFYGVYKLIVKIGRAIAEN